MRQSEFLADTQRADKPVEKEYDFCCEPADYLSLRGELDRLGTKTSSPFTQELAELDERISETEPKDLDRSDNPSWHNPGEDSDREADTDDSIRELFGALVE